jgi:hypothetical protein
MNGAVVVDTNVPIAASRRSEQASPACVLRCEEAVLRVLNDQVRLALDDDGLIIEEYRANLSPSGEPGIGDRFLKWVLTNWANPARCDLVPITSIEGRGFEEFPDRKGLERFDPSDRKFVAVAHAHGGTPPILQALDSKWWGYQGELQAAGLVVTFLCPTEVRTTYERKHGASMKGRSHERRPKHRAKRRPKRKRRG